MRAGLTFGRSAGGFGATQGNWEWRASTGLGRAREWSERGWFLAVVPGGGAGRRRSRGEGRPASALGSREGRSLGNRANSGGHRDNLGLLSLILIFLSNQQKY